MSYKCDCCGAVVPHRQKCIKYIAQKRQKTYRNFEGRYLGEGWEIEEEQKLCKQCAKDKNLVEAH